MFARTLSRYHDVAPLLLRLSMATIFFYQGFSKWSFWTDAPPQMSEVMIGIMKVLSIVEPLAALLLLLGIFTEVGAIAIAIVMIGALWTKLSQGQALPVWMIDLSLLSSALAVLFFGPGRFSLEGVLRRRVL